MLGAVGLDVGMHRNEILQTWLRENADAGSQMVLHAQSEGGGELPRGTDVGLLTGLIQALHVIVGIQGGMDWYFRNQTSTAVKTPCLTAIYVE